VWHEQRPVRFFRDRDITVSLQGRKEASRVFKLPALAALLAPGTCADVPQRMVVRARRGNDDVELTLDVHTISQVVIPNETDTNSMTMLNEATGGVSMGGSILGKKLELEGVGVFEFIRR